MIVITLISMKNSNDSNNIDKYGNVLFLAKFEKIQILKRS